MKKIGLLRILAIIYLGWAVIYSILVLPSWLPKVIAFKSSGSSDLVWQLETLKYKVYEDSFTKTNGSQAMELTITKQADDEISFLYAWGSKAKLIIRNRHERYKKPLEGTLGWFQFLKDGRNWSIWFATNKESGKRFFEVVKKDAQGLKIDPENKSWHPISEAAFVPQITQWYVSENIKPIIVALGPIGIALMVIFLVPFHYINAYIAALSPYPIFYLTVFIPTLTYVFLLWSLIRRVDK